MKEIIFTLISENPSIYKVEGYPYRIEVNSKNTEPVIRLVLPKTHTDPESLKRILTGYLNTTIY